LEFIKKHFLKKEFLIFLIIGGVNTLSGTAFAYIYSILTQANLAFMLGYLSALALAYVLNSKFTFKERSNFTGFVKFVVSYVPNFIIQNVAVLIFYNGLYWNRLVAYAAAAAAGIPVTFLLLKIFAFKKDSL
jgi:putative flippase GtrA